VEGDKVCALERLDPARVAVIPNGIDVAAYAPRGRRDAARAGLGLAPEDTFVLAVGNLLRVKGHATLIEAAARLAAKRPAARIRVGIAGAGPLENDLRALAARILPGGAVQLLGARDDVRDLLEACDIFALPSLSEGMSNALLEAAAAGRPIVATAAGGNPEVVRPDREALLVPPGDADALATALATFADAPALARALGDAARARAQTTFTIEAMAARYAALYEEIARGEPCGAPALPPSRPRETVAPGPRG
jgi:glycosyltransferase involved in cell wall biosynthesis